MAESAVIGVRVGEGLMGERVEAFVVRAAGGEVDFDLLDPVRVSTKLHERAQLWVRT